MYATKVMEELYETMLRIRICEESLVDPILQQQIKTPCHLYTGQEAVATGVCASLGKDDYVFGSHRSHGYYLAKGGNLKMLMAEIYGKKTGCAGGRGGSMHVIAPEVGFMGAVPIVGGTISLALGAALATQIRGENKVGVSFFGDGATGQGIVYECLNFASLKRLPMLFICENNFYSTHLPLREIRPNDEIFKVALPFDIPSFQVDGNNVLEVYETTQRAVERARAGKGPTFMECRTYRLRGHVGPDDNIQGTHTDIRPREEIEAWKRKDPIERLAQFLLEQGYATQSVLDTYHQKVEREVEQAHQFAKESPYPSKEELNQHIFA